MPSEKNNISKVMPFKVKKQQTQKLRPIHSAQYALMANSTFILLLNHDSELQTNIICITHFHLSLDPKTFTQTPCGLTPFTTISPSKGVILVSSFLDEPRFRLHADDRRRRDPGNFGGRPNVTPTPGRNKALYKERP